MDTIQVKDLQITKSVLENKLKNYFGDSEQNPNDNGFKLISEQLTRVNELLKIGEDIKVDCNGELIKSDSYSSKSESTPVKKRTYRKRTY